MSIESWDDIRMALVVAQTGTVSGAADKLGVHHATVIRRIDALEAQLGTRLFQRHPRGYTLTEAGQTMLQTAGAAAERFAQMAARITGAGDQIAGELVVTSLPGLSDLVMPRFLRLTRQHPDLRLRYLTDPRLYRLDAGEAHVAIRAGAQPTEPDYVVQPFTSRRQSLFASQAYLDAHGPITDPAQHRFCLPGPDARGAPIMRWLTENVPAENIVLISNDSRAREAMIRADLAVGPMMEGPDESDGLVELMSLPEWDSTLWLVTHVDLHRTPKVQAALAALKGD